MHGWRNYSGEGLVVEREPANVGDRYLFGLAIEIKASGAVSLFCLLDEFVELAILPHSIVSWCGGKKIEGKRVVGIWKVCAPLLESKLDLVIGYLDIIRVGFYRQHVNPDSQGRFHICCSARLPVTKPANLDRKRLRSASG